MNRAKAAIRTARALLANGILGPNLQESLLEAHPALTPVEKKRVAKVIEREIGILGQAAHDPNQYTSCRKAAQAKETHPHPHTLIMTYRTPMCASCSYNRKGRCNLMGGKLIDGPKDIPEEAVSRTAKLLVSDSKLTEVEAKRIARATLTPGTRVAGLHLRKELPLVNDTEDTIAQAESRRVASMMDSTGQSICIKPKKLTGPSRTKNAEANQLEDTWAAQPGDTGARKASRESASILVSEEMPVKLPKGLRKASRRAAGQEDPLSRSERQFTEAQADSRRAAAILDNSGLSVGVRQGSLTGPGRAKNSEDVDGSLAWNESPGDGRVANKAREIADSLRPIPTHVDIPGAPDVFDNRVQIASFSSFDLPVEQVRGKRSASAVEEEHVTQAQEQHNKIIKFASSLLGQGKMSARVASQLHERLDTLEQNGARATRTAKNITNQLAVLSGKLELEL